MHDLVAGAQEPIAVYRARLAAGRLHPDPDQQRAVERLQLLYRALLDRRAEHGRRGWLARLGLTEGNGKAAPVGLYLCGPVGRGKSMLMDLFFDVAPLARKRRVHFHAFMLEVHDRLERARRKKSRDPLQQVTRDIAGEARLFCFDEFQVDDIADAMILERLFRGLFDAGSVIVATSNRAPDELYAHGLNRERFLPFIALLKARLDILTLDSGRDWRLARMIGRNVYHQPLGPAAQRALEDAFAALTDDAAAGPTHLTVKGRSLPVPRAAGNIAWFGFADLCEAPLAAADYLALAERFAAIILDGIPRLAPSQRNAARRFTILIDTLYEARTLLIASAAAPPGEIYVEGNGSLDFRRTASRLVEMQSEDYIANRPRR